MHEACADPSAVAILPHGVDGHLVAEVVAGMRLQRAVLLTSQLHVRRPSGMKELVTCHAPRRLQAGLQAVKLLQRS